MLLRNMTNWKERPPTVGTSRPRTPGRLRAHESTLAAPHRDRNREGRAACTPAISPMTAGTASQNHNWHHLPAFHRYSHFTGAVCWGGNA